MAKWIDSSGFETVGTVGFLVEVDDTSNGGTRWHLRDTPQRTNQSHQPRLYGWCGETNNKSVHARGLHRVTRVTKSHDRIQVVPIEGAELVARLEELGYPELAE